MKVRVQKLRIGKDNRLEKYFMEKQVQNKSKAVEAFIFLLGICSKELTLGT